MIKGYLQVLFLVFCVGFNYAQNLKFKTYQTENGLSNNSVTSIAVDQDASLWIGTWDGLNFYDGHEFIVYKHDPNDSTSISGNYIYKSKVDDNHRIWFLTNSRYLSLLQKDKTFKNYAFSKKPTKIGLDASGQLWVEVKKDIYVFDGTKFNICPNCKSKQEENYWEKLLLNYYPDVIVNATLKDQKANIWIGTFKHGLFYIPADKIPNLKPDDIEQYTKDIYDNFGLSSNEIDAISEDPFGNVWLGTKDGGIQRVYTNSEQIYYISNHPVKQPDLPNETIRAIDVDEEDIWLGFYTKGLFKRDAHNSKFTKVTLDRSRNNPDWNRIRSLYRASDGSLFGGTYAGVFRVNDDDITYYTAEDTPYLVNNRNYAFFENDQQQIYVACWDGVALFDLKKNQFIPFENQSLLDDYHVRDLREINGKLFIATETRGVLIFDGKKIQKILPDKSIYTLWHEKANDKLWIGSLQGIFIYDLDKQEVIKKINEDDGLLSHLVYAILGTENHIWCSTTKGLVTIDKNTYEVIPHPAEEGFQSKEFSEGAYFKDRKGMLYFGGINGLNYFNPSKINLKEPLPIIKVYVDGKNLNFIEKPHRHNNIEFIIDPTFYGIARSNKILYKLEGFDEEWQAKDYHREKIIYEDLDAGEYNFLVKNAIGNQAIEFTSKVIIHKPFWQTLPFYIVLAFLTLSILILWFYLNKRALQKKEQILEEKIKNRVATISQQKKDIAEMNTLLLTKNKEITDQQNQLQKLHAQLKTETMELKKFSSFLANEYKKPLSKIYDTLQALPDSTEKISIQKGIAALMNKVLEWDYLGQINLDDEVIETAIELEEFGENMIKEFIQKSDEKGVKYAIKKETKELWINIDVLKFKLLLNYIVTDIFKYRQENSKAWLEYKISEEKVYFQIKSNQQILVDNLYNIQRYSPYFQASKVLSKLLNITLNVRTEDINTIFEIEFKPNVINPTQKIDVGMNWEHAGISQEIDDDKHNLLIWSAPHVSQFISKIIPEDYNVLQESDSYLLFSVLKTIRIQILMIYNLSINEELLTVVHNVKNQYPTIKIVYMSEDIDYELEQRIVDLGMDISIQLPVKKKFLKHKLHQVISPQTSQLEREENVYNLLGNILKLEKPNSDEKLIHQAVQIIQDKMSDPDFNVSELYKSLKISKIKCYRVFKDVLNIPPSEFILNLKIKKAKALLKATNLNIAEVAYEVGFSDPKYFSKVFKKYVGISPKKFKAEAN